LDNLSFLPHLSLSLSLSHTATNGPSALEKKESGKDGVNLEKKEKSGEIICIDD